MDIKKKCKNGWTFIKDHEGEIIAYGIGIVSVIGFGMVGVKLYRFDKLTRVHKKAYEAVPKALVEGVKGLTSVIAKVDEEIFTDLAPAIEDIVLDKNVQNAVIERSYDIGENIIKNVVVNIK